MELELERLEALFIDIFNQQAESRYFSPGRVNLIGEHTDYNGGYVLPCAITQGTLALVKKRSDQEVQCYSDNFPEAGVISFHVEDELEYSADDQWVNYVKGMVKFVRESGHVIDQGFDLLVYGNIPNGAGLSSSASLELLIGVVLESEFALTLDRLDLVRMGQRVENEFLGLHTGIMDQFAIGMGQADHAIYLDVNELDYKLVPADFGDNVILIMNTNKRRELTTSKYNERRAECEQALSELQVDLAINNLCELSPEELIRHKDLLSTETLWSRSKHVVFENARTQKAVELLEANQLEQFGTLMNDSHNSLRDDYDVTGVELDALVEAAWKQEGVLGARMTGAGMGGCAIALVNKDKVEHIIDAISKEYKDQIGYDASFYIAEVGDGARKL